MLILSRKADEEIIIGDNIRITVVQIRGNQIRLGISAPDDISIRRSEVAPLQRKEEHSSSQFEFVNCD